jgi:osmotically-inducible protein OsmY
VNRPNQPQLRHLNCWALLLAESLSIIHIPKQTPKEIIQMSTTSAILKTVQAAFEHEPRINLHQYPIHVALSNGDLIVEGEVANVAAKKLGLELAASVSGTTGIVDRLRVVPAQRMGDGTIRDHVRDAFLQEPVLKTCTIQAWTKNQLETYQEVLQEPAGVITIGVEDGVVTLNGRVPSLSHKRLAGVLVWWAVGMSLMDSMSALTKRIMTMK